MFQETSHEDSRQHNRNYDASFKIIMLVPLLGKTKNEMKSLPKVNTENFTQNLNFRLKKAVVTLGQNFSKRQ